jgi:DNA polymerase III subunit delta
LKATLLAAAQEIEKLKLMAEGGQITVETVQAAVADSARFRCVRAGGCGAQW